MDHVSSVSASNGRTSGWHLTFVFKSYIKTHFSIFWSERTSVLRLTISDAFNIGRLLNKAWVTQASRTFTPSFESLSLSSYCSRVLDGRRRDLCVNTWRISSPLILGILGMPRADVAGALILLVEVVAVERARLSVDDIEELENEKSGLRSAIANSK